LFEDAHYLTKAYNLF